MKSNGSQVSAARNGRRCLIPFAVSSITLVMSAATALAQNVPYQASQRNAFGSGLGQSDLPRGSFFEPRVEGAIQYVDNINLDSGPEQINTAGIELSPGFYASYNSDHFIGAIDYSLIGRLWDNGEFDDITHELAANGRWTAVPDLFYVDAAAGYADTVLDAGRSLNYGGLGIFGSDNLAERANASVSPTLRKEFKNLEFVATYSYGRVWYLDVGKGAETTPLFSTGFNDDSEDQSADVSLGTVDDGGKLSGSVFYSWDKSTYEQSLPYQYERAGFDGAFMLSRTLSIVGDVGKESQLDESTTEGGLDSDFWSAGFRWSTEGRSSVEARYGERFFGESYSADIVHTARLLEFTASYSESPQVETRQISLGEFVPGELPPWIDPGNAIGLISSSPYVSRDARLAVQAKGSRTTLGLNAFGNEREYLNEVFGDEEGTGVAFTATRDLAQNASIDFTVAYSDYLRDETLLGPTPLEARHDYDTQLVLRGNRDFGPRVEASIETGFLNRSGQQDYDGWWVGLRGRWIPELR